jgi:hypothetical protein
MLARKHIEKGEKLVSVPRKLWMTSKTAKESPICGQLIQNNTIDDWTVRPSVDCYGQPTQTSVIFVQMSRDSGICSPGAT